MGLLRWFTRNWANTQGPTHTDLAPLVLPLPPAEAREQVQSVVATMPRWRVEGMTDGDLHLTRRTRLWRFVDDVRLRFLPAGPGCLIHAESRSRVGVGDLGQNRRNILELWDAIRANK
jgi:uncharacterized protein (DUF1499 family)